MLTNRFASFVLCLIICTVATLAPAWGQANVTYDVTHNLSVSPAGNPAIQVWGSYLATVAVSNPSGRASRTNTGRVQIQSGTLRLWNAHAGPIPSEGDANARWQINFGLGGPVSGFARSNGWASARPPTPSSALSQASVGIMVFARQQLPNGQIIWNPILNDWTQGMGTAVNTTPNRRVDPIVFRVKDLVTGDVVNGTLLDIKYVIDGDGSLSWEKGILSMDASQAASATFHINMTSPYIPLPQQGYLDLVITNNIITQSDDDGIFDGLLPPVGTPGAFDMALSNNLVMDYNFGDFQGHPVDAYLYLGGGADNVMPLQLVSNIAEIKSLPLDTEVEFIEPKVATNDDSAYEDSSIYIEEETRASGVRCYRVLNQIMATGSPVLAGNRVRMHGFVRNDVINDERYLEITKVLSNDPGLQLGPLGMSNKSIPHVSGPLDAAGLLVKTWGRITFREPHGWYVYVDDGAGLHDGTVEMDGTVNTGIRVVLDEQAAPIAIPPEVNYITVTGAAGRTSGWIPCIRPASQSDIQFQVIAPS